MNQKIKRLIPMVLVLPFGLSVVSCSTTWIHWKRGQDEETNFKFGEDKIGKPLVIRDTKKLIRFAWDNQVLDLNKLNNHYELINVLGSLFHLKSTEPIHNWWEIRNWNQFTNKNQTGYFDKFKPTFKLKFKLGTQISELPIIYDFTSILEGIVEGFNVFKTNQEKAFNVEGNGLDSNGLPRDLLGISTVGAPFLNVPLVQNILSYDLSFALKLSKLTNLPLTSFNDFTNLMIQLNVLTEKIATHQLIIDWMLQLDLDFSWDKTGNPSNKNNLDRIAFFKTKFILENLQ